MNRRDIEITLGAVVDRHPPKGERAVPVQHFAYCADLAEQDGPGTSVRSANFARAVLDRICGNEPGTLIEGYPDEAEYRHLWRITLTIAPTRGARARIGADYRAERDCPLDQRQEMMSIFRALKDAMREGRAAR